MSEIVTQHAKQRVGVFIDVQNMYHSAKHLFSSRVNFGNVLKSAVADRELIRAIGYVSVSQSPEEEGFFQALHMQGFEVKMKDLQVFPDGTKKGDWDVGITIDCVRLANKLDTIVLVTGDGDYVVLVEYLQNCGVRVELMSFAKSTSSRLIDSVDFFYDMDVDHKKFLIKPKTKSS